MTISDFIARLNRLQKEIGPVAQIKLGKEYNQSDPCFDYFDIGVANGDVYLVPSDIWERKRTVVPLQLHSVYGVEE
jgi:hypothetical protein